MIEKYGKPAAVALSARKIPFDSIKSILDKEPKLSDTFYELVLDAERKALSKRFS